ncbi:hypothetical protein J2Z50_003227 [Ensifer mexicanus]|nr:hypothetical protein [Sinorhizobium mexicanum]
MMRCVSWDSAINQAILQRDVMGSDFTTGQTIRIDGGQNLI